MQCFTGTSLGLQLCSLFFSFKVSKLCGKKARRGLKAVPNPCVCLCVAAACPRNSGQRGPETGPALALEAAGPAAGSRSCGSQSSSWKGSIEFLLLSYPRPKKQTLTNNIYDAGNNKVVLFENLCSIICLWWLPRPSKCYQKLSEDGTGWGWGTEPEELRPGFQRDPGNPAEALVWVYGK